MPAGQCLGLILFNNYIANTDDGCHDDDAYDDFRRVHDHLSLTLQQRTGLSRGLWGQKEEKVKKLISVKYILTSVKYSSTAVKCISNFG